MALELSGTTGVSLVQDGVVTAADLASGAITSGALPAGSVLQVVQTVKTNTFSSTSTSFVDVTGMSATITPSSASNKILVIVNMTVGTPNSNFVLSNLVRGSTTIAQPTTASSFEASMNSYPGDSLNGANQIAQVLTWLDSPNTTDATTYKIQSKTTNVLTFYINSRPVAQNGTTVSSITLMEIAG